MNTNRFIFESSKKSAHKNSKRKSGNFRRSMAAAFDSFILLFVRGLVLQIYGKIYFIAELIKFGEDFQREFGTETPKLVPSHTQFIIHHPISIAVLVAIIAVILIGAIYHGWFCASNWRATIGKRIFEIEASTKDGKKLSFIRGASHYLLSVVPLAYVIHIALQSIINSSSIYHTISNSGLNLAIGILFVIWVQFSFLTKSKATISDLICKITITEGRTNSKFPWKSKAKSHSLVS